ncbi:MAG: hypothetical protein ACK56I_09025 [bacterium]
MTGTGPGESHGLQKPENHCGCGCGGGGEKSPVVSASKTRLGCHRRYSVGSANVRYSSGSVTAASKSCF